MAEFEFVKETPDLPALVNGQQVALIPFVVTVEDQPAQGDPDGADWKGAESVDWANDPMRQRIHRVGVYAYLSGNRNLWHACYCAHAIVGRYARGATSAFASDISKSVDTVENMAHAADLYLRLAREFLGTKDKPSQLRHLIPKLREIRRKLSFSHFHEMWSLWRSDPKLSALAVFAELETAAENGIGSRSLGTNGKAQAGKTATVCSVYGLRSDYIADLINHPEGRPADTYIVVLQGREWVGVSEVKVRPA